MPTYNQDKYIKEAIDSIMSQKETDWILYIVNDGSTDNTDKIIEPYLCDKIKYFKKENGGTSSALNHGFKQSKGIYHTYASSDNVYLPEFLGTLSNMLDSKEDIGFVCSDFQYMDKDKNLGAIVTWPSHVKKPLIEQCFIGICYMWKADVYEKVGGFDEQCDQQDYDFALKVEEISKLDYKSVILGLYRDHPETVTNTKGLRHLNVLLENAKKRRRIQ